MHEYSPTTPISSIKEHNKIFLAGTIDNGEAELWGKSTVQFFKTLSKFKDWAFINPRRSDWDSSWEQSINNPQFKEQVEWELEGLAISDIIIMNFLPNSKSPITLLELGLFADSGKIICCCPDEFWRSGNVHIVCEKYKIPLYKNYQNLLYSFSIN